MGEPQQEPEAQPQEEPQAQPPVGALTQQEERMWAMLAHLLALAGFVVPFGNVIGPLVIWLIQKDKSAFVDENGKESVNFQISVTIYLLVSIVLVFVVVGIVLLPAVVVFQIVVVIMAAVKANDGESYKYPLCIRFIK